MRDGFQNIKIGTLVYWKPSHRTVKATVARIIQRIPQTYVSFNIIKDTAYPANIGKKDYGAWQWDQWMKIVSEEGISNEYNIKAKNGTAIKCQVKKT